MGWVVPEKSRNQVNKAGQTLCTANPSSDEYKQAMDILNNWRSSHAYPINTFQATLRQKVKRIDQNALVAQRLKRTPSIISKLKRFDGMKLARMQDIGGLRAVVATRDEVYRLEKSYRQSHFKHILVDEYDYIQHPKSSGYRSIHLIYKYQNPAVPVYNDLLLELQIRTKIQHAWATAVETMGIFLDYALKSSEGPEKWLFFFALAGSAFAYLEDCPPVEKFAYLNKQKTYERLISDSKKLDVKSRLRAFAVAAHAISQDRGRGNYHLIVLDPTKKVVKIKTYGRRRLDEANYEYTQEELRISQGELIQVVLVSAGPIDALRRAYPNFFLDTREFIKHLDSIEKSLIKE